MMIMKQWMKSGNAFKMKKLDKQCGKSKIGFPLKISIMVLLLMML